MGCRSHCKYSILRPGASLLRPLTSFYLPSEIYVPQIYLSSVCKEPSDKVNGRKSGSQHTFYAFLGYLPRRYSSCPCFYLCFAVDAVHHHIPHHDFWKIGSLLNYLVVVVRSHALRLYPLHDCFRVVGD